MDYTSALVGGVPLILVVIGLVEWFKRLGIPGKALPFISMGIGLVFGVAYQYMLTPLVGFGAWFGAIVYGLGLGLVASGIYDAVKSATGADDYDYLDPQ